MHDFTELLEKLGHGECLSGSFIRRAADNGRTIAFEELLVHTYNTEYRTDDPKQNETFFSEIDYSGCGTRSNYSEQEHCNRYETLGNWHNLGKR